jgi:hypothetical protein
LGEVFDNFAVDVLCELHGALDAAGGAHPAALAGERYKERVLALLAEHPRGTMSKDAAIEVLIEGFLQPHLPTRLQP